IDGPAASGKSTLAQMLADKLGYLYLDTGVMYRAVTLAALEKGCNLADEKAVTALAQTADIDVRPASVNDSRMYDVWLDNEDVTWKIRQADVEDNVSPVSAYKGVRQAMTQQQRQIGKRGKMVMAGRDIGTVVFPDAELKIYLKASLEVRARRRYEELRQRGENPSFEDVISNLRIRDQIDSGRAVAPLKPADDAIIIDTDDMDQQQVFDKMMSLLE
ncbi:MAG TPA: (d)CMP kinase, partial [Longilinea sp.]|nr:(d)CMP kinase [Longilinea sp.]